MNITFMKKLLCLLFLLLQVSFNLAAQDLKVAFYADAGTKGNGYLNWIIALSHTPGIYFEPVSGADIAAGKLQGFDVIFMPGGSSQIERKTLGEAGCRELKKFISEGGSYIGICAGFALALDWEHGLGLFNVKRAGSKHTGRGHGEIHVKIEKKGADLLGVKPGTYAIKYSNGPIPDAMKDHEAAYACYAGTIGTPKQAAVPGIYDRAALLYANYGKGKVIASSYHPEYFRHTLPLGMGCFHAVSGKKFAPVFTVKNLRPLRLGMLTLFYGDKDSASAVAELSHTKDIDVRSLNDFEVKSGELNHCDALLILDINKGYKRNWKTLKQVMPMLQEFQKNGGIVMTPATIEAEKVIKEQLPGMKLIADKAHPAAEVRKYCAELMKK